jgi:hypothetical protein
LRPFLVGTPFKENRSLQVVSVDNVAILSPDTELKRVVAVAVFEVEVAIFGKSFERILLVRDGADGDVNA